MGDLLLRVKDLYTHFYTFEGTVKALDGISLELKRAETLGLVGETGCGKSVTALSILGLIPCPPGKVEAAEIWFDGVDLLKLDKEEMRAIRGKKIAMIFQEPATALNPVFPVGEQTAEIIRIHKQVSKREGMQKAVEMFHLVGIPDPDRVSKKYPHELSGGMNQRVMIAAKLSSNPALLVADEPTTALDVTVQAQILQLMKGLVQRFRTAVIFITHDLGVVAEICDRVAVMYAGVIVESSKTRVLFENPRHPYTRSLLQAIPKLVERIDRLPVISGTVPSLINPPSGCRFHPRCSLADSPCKVEKPSPTSVEAEHWVSCFRYDQGD
ncbi:MAG: ATP-binding cassette domain-containing protein [Proteobacteria bacterium]|nr:ATP-binding cassette domain-containing protein [Pseudomonadota bacterium]NIS70584.1 ATP-binding cassette domain-containing protein [Pseudomonadota bacterium]